MGWVERIDLVVETDASGDGSAISMHPVTGDLIDIEYVKDGTAGYADGVDFVVTAEPTGRVLWDQDNVNDSARVAPRQPVHTTAGVALLYAAGGQPLVDRIALSYENLQVVVAAGGATKTGTFRITVKQ